MRRGWISSGPAIFFVHISGHLLKQDGTGQEIQTSPSAPLYKYAGM